jgi:hypothetical protein
LAVSWPGLVGFPAALFYFFGKGFSFSSFEIDLFCNASKFAKFCKSPRAFKTE